MIQVPSVFTAVEAKLNNEVIVEPCDLSAVAAACGITFDLKDYSVTADAVEKIAKFEVVVRQRLLVQTKSREDTSIDSTLDLNRKRFRCHLCSFSSVRSNHLAKHLATHGKVEVLFECNEAGCDFRCIRDGTLARHRLTHAGQSFNCPRSECNFRTVSAQLLKKHVKYKHEAAEAADVEAETEYHKCLECDYRTRSRHFFDRHRRRHDRRMKSTLKSKIPSPSPFHCSECSYSTRKRANLDRHLSSVHGNLRKFLCKFCGVRFKRRDTMKQHQLATHGAEIADDFARQGVAQVSSLPRCQFCDRLCRNGTALADHVAAAHSDSVPRDLCQCHVCGVTFTTSAAATKHARTVHGKPKEVFRCQKCPKRFVAKEALEKHMKLAAGHQDVGETVIYTLHLGDKDPLSSEDMRSYLVRETAVVSSDGTVEISNSAETIPNP